MSRNLNEGSSFSALQTSGRFVNFHGPANVVLEGRVHHELRDTTLDPRRVVIFGRTDPRPQEVPVLSPLYEPLQYPLDGGTGPTLNCNGTGASFNISVRATHSGSRSVCLARWTHGRRASRRGRRLQAAGMDEPADPSVPNFFQYKIPGSFMGSRAWCSDQVADALADARTRQAVFLAYHDHEPVLAGDPE